MKNIRKSLVFLLGIVLLPSCSQNEILTKENAKDSDIVDNTIESSSSHFQLLSKKLLCAKESRVLRTNTISYESAYDSSIPIYRYYYGGSYEDIDHYHSTEYSQTLYLYGNKYDFEFQEFNTVSTNWTSSRPLYRYYSSILNDHLLSTESSVSSYTKEGTIGNIFPTQQVGTIPLMEYYAPERQSHTYVVRDYETKWIQEHDPEFTYNKTIGYVYPGEMIDPSEQTRFILKKKDQWYDFKYGVRLVTKVKEEENYWELTYSVDLNLGDSIVIPINRNYIIVAADFVADKHDQYPMTTIQNITNPDEVYYSKPVSGGNGRLIRLHREIRGYDIILTFWDDYIVGLKEE